MILIVGVLITVNAADARPAGTIIKEGVLTYPAGPYLTEYSLLNLETDFPQISDYYSDIFIGKL